MDGYLRSTNKPVLHENSRNGTTYSQRQQFFETSNDQAFKTMDKSFISRQNSPNSLFSKPNQSFLASGEVSLLTEKPQKEYSLPQIEHLKAIWNASKREKRQSKRLGQKLNKNFNIYNKKLNKLDRLADVSQ